MQYPTENSNRRYVRDDLDLSFPAALITDPFMHCGKIIIRLEAGGLMGIMKGR